MHMGSFQVLWFAIFSTACVAWGLTGCQSPEQRADEASASFACHGDRGFPYPSGIPYVGVHGSPGNNDVIPCDTHTQFEQKWHALQGHAVAQPNTFSPDGRIIYVTTSQPAAGDCNVWALNADDGSVAWCRDLGPGAIWGTVEVDEDGHLYLTSWAGVHSLADDGRSRWTLSIPEGRDPGRTNGAIGLHFTPDGHIVTVTDQGLVLLISRSDGRLVSSLDVPGTFGFELPSIPDVGIRAEDVLPEVVLEDFRRLQHGSVSTLLSVFSGAANFSDNTVGVAPDGRIYVMGGGDAGSGLFQIRQTTVDGRPILQPGWHMPTQGGSATSPAISPDGRYVKVSDGNGALTFLSPLEANAMTRVADIDACDQNIDRDPDSLVCGEAFSVPLLTGPTMGTNPMLDGGIHYQYEIQVADLMNTDSADIRCFEEEELVWEVALPDELQWSSVITVSNNHLIGTATRFTDSGERLLTLELPAVAQSELLVLSRENGAVVFRAPVTDDSTSTVTIAPDGSLYVTMLSLLHTLSLETRPVGGVIRFAPTH